LLKGLGKLPPEEKKTAGARDQRRQGRAVEAALNERVAILQGAQLEARLAEEALDVTLPGRG
jgi:phenylalanyl-tRNA synthetase alpha chain